MSSETNGENDHQQDLDAFLHGVESKLRGPYSSLELSKAVMTPSLRGSNISPKDFLELVSQVISRPDKVVQMRILIGFLGLDPNEENDRIVYTILRQTQEEAPTHEDWVRVISGLVSGVMFVHDEEKKDGDEDYDDSPTMIKRTCRGELASKLLNEACKDILQRVLEFEQETEPPPPTTTTTDTDKDNNKLSASLATAMLTADMYPLFIPYRYSLLNPDLLARVVPEAIENPHFQVNSEASILCMDEKLEKAKAQEEFEHNAIKADANGANGDNGAKGKESAPKREVFMPGGGRLSSNATTKGRKGTVSKSLFMPTKRPGMAGSGTRPGAGRQPRAQLHTRRAGAAKFLLETNKKRMLSQTNATAGIASAGIGAIVGGAVPSTVGRAASKLANNKSKMKMIDVTEVKGLNEEHKQREVVLTREQKISARKRKIMEAAASNGLKQRKSIFTTASATSAAAAAAATQQQQQNSASIGNGSAADQQQFSSLQQMDMDNDDTVEDPHHTIQLQLQQQQQQLGFGALAASSTMDDDDDNIGNVGTSNKQQELKQILSQRSNKLSADDRFRVEQFYPSYFNPTPGVQIVKMKLHEERTVDPNTGKEVKETYYLELDYNTPTWTQSKKVKRYD